ncbi:hypothetical protein HWV62_26378 [Athelia sp. TMB]|nr:hypothetical protein HWV62_26378 [Athelia sp. TMB]
MSAFAVDTRIDPYNRLQFNTYHIHTVLKLSLENILIHLQKPPTDDLANFLGFCKVWADVLEGHHDTEEMILFPFLATKLDMSSEIEQHKVIHDALMKFNSYVIVAQADTAKFDALKMQQALVALKDPLFEHLDEEVEHLTPENLHVFTATELNAIWDKLEHHAHTRGDPWLELPFILRHLTPDVKAVFPDMPWVVKNVLTPWGFHWRYRGGELLYDEDCFEKKKKKKKKKKLEMIRPRTGSPEENLEETTLVAVASPLVTETCRNLYDAMGESRVIWRQALEDILGVNPSPDISRRIPTMTAAQLRSRAVAALRMHNLWDTGNVEIPHKSITRLPCREGTARAELGPDGRWILTQHLDGSLNLWNSTMTNPPLATVAPPTIEGLPNREARSVCMGLLLTMSEEGQLALAIDSHRITEQVPSPVR